MDPQPSSSGGTNFQGCEACKVGRKTYVPHLFASRPLKVKANSHEEVEKVANICAKGRRYDRQKKLHPGAATFTSVLNAKNSDLTVENRPKINDSPPNGELDVVKAILDGDESSNDEDPRVKVATKFHHSEFARVSSACLSDLPISIPRPQLSSSDDAHELISLLMDNSLDLSCGKSVKFLLKTPQFLSMMCTLHEMPDAQIGKLQVMKSNRLRLVLGECKLWLHPGVHATFREEVACVDVDVQKKTGEIVSLGDVKGRIITIPDCVASFAIATDNPWNSLENE